jgi:N5-(carboxyethyl)ornithine synthase
MEYLMNSKGEPALQDNSFLTGKMGVLHGIAYAGKIPEDCIIAIIGRGPVGQGAFRQLKDLGTKEIDVFHRGNIRELYLPKYDVIVHCAHSTKEIISAKQINSLKRGALLIHVGSDCIAGDFGANSIYSPVTEFNLGRNLVYCVNHVPTMAYQTASRKISEAIWPYLDEIIQTPDNGLVNSSKVMNNGKVILKKLNVGK